MYRHGDISIQEGRSLESMGMAGRIGRIRLEKEIRQNPVVDQYLRNSGCCQIKQNKLFRKENLERVKVNEIKYIHPLRQA